MNARTDFSKGGDPVSDSSTLPPSTEPNRQSDRPTPIDPARREAKRAKPISNLRHKPVNHFVGRDDLLESLRDALCSGHPAALTQALTGLGGIGKTQLAVQYAHRSFADYDVIWWVNAETYIDAVGGLADLAGPLDLAEKDTAELERKKDAVLDWLSTHVRWLLIFDNAEQPDDLTGCLPHESGGHVIITSRNPNWRAVATPLTVEPLKISPSAKFLLARTGKNEPNAAESLARELGGLPIFLTQAAANIEVTGSSIAEYLHMFLNHRERLWAKEKAPRDHEQTGVESIEINLEAIEFGQKPNVQPAPAAVAIMNLCAFLAPDNIPLDLFAGGAKHIPYKAATLLTNPVDLGEAIAALRRYSLVDVSDHTLSVHRLVQQIVRDRLAVEKQTRVARPESAKGVVPGDELSTPFADSGRATQPGDPNTRPQSPTRSYAAAAVKMVNDAFPGVVQTNTAAWPVCNALMTHAQSAARHAEELGIEPDATGRLLNQIGIYLQIRAEFVEARHVLERTVRIAEKAFGPEHPKVATAVNNLGNVLLELGDMPGARQAIERALKIDVKAFGPEHPNVAIRANNIGNVLRAIGDLPGARQAFERALKIDEKAFGPEHPNMARDVNNLGSVLRDLWDLSGARQAFERALKIAEKEFGPEHPHVAVFVNNLGDVLKGLGDLPEARKAFERALKIDENAFGPEHPNVAISANNLGSVRQDLGDLLEARKAFERALGILRKFLGDEHPRTQAARRNLEGVKELLGSKNEASE